ncbi:MAG: YigZ family protein [Bacteroidales bacterium]|nr:YigZ family protein [Bacteroidales bacterium]
MPNIPESDCYQTIASYASGVYKEKGSKFLAFAYPVSNEDKIKEYLKEVKKEHFDARHHCFAYRLGSDGAVWRANDDGEPSSSAGKPILGQLLSFQVSDALIIVVRYFGGVKLGVPGLINAYRQAAADALQHSVIVTKYAKECATLIFPYSQMNQVMKLLKDFSVDIITQQFEQECRLSFSVRQSHFSDLSQKLNQIEHLIITS